MTVRESPSADKNGGRDEPSLGDKHAYSDGEALALVGIALTVGVGVLALPFEWSTIIRALIALLSAILVLFVLARFPKLSQVIVHGIRKTGPLLDVAVMIVFLVVRLAPTVSLSPSVIATVTAVGIGASAAMGLDAAMLISHEIIEGGLSMFSRRGLLFWRFLLLRLALAGFWGGLGTFAVRLLPNGEAFTDHLISALVVGAASFGLGLVVSTGWPGSWLRGSGEPQ
jgi:hypothetical protein